MSTTDAPTPQNAPQTPQETPEAAPAAQAEIATEPETAAAEMDSELLALREQLGLIPSASHAMESLKSQIPLTTRLPEGFIIYEYGIDFAWTKYSGSVAKSLGAKFGCSYLSNDPSKDWNRALMDSYLSLDMGVVFVWETTATRAMGGFVAGQYDAHAAASLMAALGVPESIPCYFANDWDVTLAQQSIVNSYFEGVNSIIGRERTGGYAGFWPHKRLFDAGVITWGWQTYAWSGGLWDERGHVQQYNNGPTYDWDRAVKTNYGAYTHGTGSPTQPQGSLRWPTLTPGTTGRDVRAAQQLLVQHLGGPLAIDGVYGPNTTQFVRNLQRNSGISVDGILGPDTWQKLIITIKKGDGGNAVRAIQGELVAYGQKALKINGWFDDPTLAAVKEFQRWRKLTIDGIVGPDTWLHILN